MASVSIDWISAVVVMVTIGVARAWVVGYPQVVVPFAFVVPSESWSLVRRLSAQRSNRRWAGAFRRVFTEVRVP